MKYETLRRFTKDESRFVLGEKYMTLAAEKIGMDRAVFTAEIKSHLMAENRDKTKAAFFDFIIEICSLTFELHKWGLLLFHIENKMYGNWILAIEVEKELAVISENNGDLRLENLDDKKLLFSAKHKKSAVFELLLFLREKESVLEIISVDESDRTFYGNYVSFDLEKIGSQEKEIEIMREEFKKYKSRLDELQNIFVENIGAL